MRVPCRAVPRRPFLLVLNLRVYPCVRFPGIRCVWFLAEGGTSGCESQEHGVNTTHQSWIPCPGSHRDPLGHGAKKIAVAQLCLRVLPDVFLPAFHKRVHATSACTSVSAKHKWQRKRTLSLRPLTFTCTRVCTVPWHSVRVPCRALPRRPFLGVLNLHVYPCARFPGIRCVWFLAEGGTSGCESQEHGVNTTHQSWTPCPGSHRDPLGRDVRKVVATQRCLPVLLNLLLPPSKNVYPRVYGALAFGAGCRGTAVCRPFLLVLNLHVYPCVRFPGIRCVWFLAEGGTSGCGSQEHGVNTAHQSWIPCPGSHRDPFGHDIRKVVATQRCLRVLPDLFLPPLQKRVHATSAYTSVSAKQKWQRKRTLSSRPLTSTCTRVCTVPWHSVRVPCRAVPRQPFLGVLNLHVYPCVRFPGIRCVWFLVEGGTSGCESQEHGVNTTHQSWIPCPGSHRDPFGHGVRKVVVAQRSQSFLSVFLLLLPFPPPPFKKRVHATSACTSVSAKQKWQRKEALSSRPLTFTCTRVCTVPWHSVRGAAPRRAAPTFPWGP